MLESVNLKSVSETKSNYSHPSSCLGSVVENAFDIVVQCFTLHDISGGRLAHMPLLWFLKTMNECIL